MEDKEQDCTEWTDEQWDEWETAYWTKRLKWTWLNERHFFIIWCTCSGILTNHPYGGFVSSSAKSSHSDGDIFSSNNKQTSLGVWFKQHTNYPTRNCNHMEKKKMFNILSNTRSFIHETWNLSQQQQSSG